VLDFAAHRGITGNTIVVGEGDDIEAARFGPLE
jgi:hypothetical protein